MALVCNARVFAVTCQGSFSSLLELHGNPVQQNATTFRIEVFCNVAEDPGARQAARAAAQPVQAFFLTFTGKSSQRSRCHLTN
jgi:hypothetical protein